MEMMEKSSVVVKREAMDALIALVKDARNASRAYWSGEDVATPEKRAEFREKMSALASAASLAEHLLALESHQNVAPVEMMGAEIGRDGV